MWLSRQYSEGASYARTQATALFNAAYFLGANVSAFLGGFVIFAFGEKALIAFLVSMGTACSFVVLLIDRQERWGIAGADRS